MMEVSYTVDPATKLNMPLLFQRQGKGKHTQFPCSHINILRRSTAKKLPSSNTVDAFHNALPTLLPPCPRPLASQE